VDRINERLGKVFMFCSDSKRKRGIFVCFFFLKIPYIMPSSFLVNGHWARELLA